MKESSQALRRPAVRAAVERLQYNNGELNAVVKELAERLQFVLGPAAPSTDNDAKGGPISCDLEQVIEQETDQVCANTHYLRSIIDRLEI